jgi:hypothetical protein
LRELYEAARDELKLYWPDRLEKTDENFNRVRMEILGLPPIDRDDDYQG